MRLSLFLAAYTLVFLSEFLDSEALYTVSALAARFSPMPVLCGSAVAFAGKMLAAVLLGRVVGKLPPSTINAASAATFFTMALVVWFRKGGTASERQQIRLDWMRAAGISFTSIFCSEWGDLEQITAAALAANYKAPMMVWLAATLALVTKAVLAITLGVGLKKRVPQPVLRYGGFCLFLVLGLISAVKFMRTVI